MPEPPYIVDRSGRARSGAVVDPSEARIGLAPRDLAFVRIDFQVRLQFDDIEVVIESPFSVERGAATYALDPDDRAELGPVLATYPGVLVANAVEPDGTRLTCGSRSRTATASAYHLTVTTNRGRSMVPETRAWSAHRVCRRS